MDRYWQSGGVTSSPVAPDSNVGGYPANGKPSVGIDGTVPGAWWYHLITEEMRNAVVALGGVPDYTQVDQLATGLVNTIASAVSDAIAQLAAVATTGEYNDLDNKPVIPAAQVNSDWLATGGVAEVLNKPKPGSFLNRRALLDTDALTDPVLSPAWLEGLINTQGTTACTLYFPELASGEVPACSAYWIYNSNAGGVTFEAQGGNILRGGGAHRASITLQGGDWAVFVWVGNVYWDMTAGTALLQYSYTHARTAAQFSSGLDLATTAFVQRALGNYNGTIASPGTLTLGASSYGALVAISGTAHTTTLPIPVDRAGVRIGLLNTTGYTQTVAAPPGTYINSAGVASNTATTYSVAAVLGVTHLVSDGSNWIVESPQLTAANVTGLAEVAKTGSYNDLLDRPAIGGLPHLTIPYIQDSTCIDQGTWLQINLGLASANGLVVTTNVDGSANLPAGDYLVTGTMALTAAYTDIYVFPVQAIYAVGMNYPFPGSIPHALQAYPASPELGSMGFSGPGTDAAGSWTLAGVLTGVTPANPVWAGLTKIIGTNSRVLIPSGNLSFVKIS